MGLRSSSEIFQMKNYEAFGDIEGVFMIADDMLIAGKDNKDHDKILETVLNRAERLNSKFNKDTIQFKVPSVKYMGNVFTAEGMRLNSDKVNVKQCFIRETVKNCWPNHVKQISECIRPYWHFNSVIFI